jgi:hypothetical protein
MKNVWSLHDHQFLRLKHCRVWSLQNSKSCLLVEYAHGRFVFEFQTFLFQTFFMYKAFSIPTYFCAFEKLAQTSFSFGAHCTLFPTQLYDVSNKIWAALVVENIRRQKNSALSQVRIRLDTLVLNQRRRLIRLSVFPNTDSSRWNS